MGDLYGGGDSALQPRAMTADDDGKALMTVVLGGSIDAGVGAGAGNAAGLAARLNG